jgi:HEPN domain-containing protein
MTAEYHNWFAYADENLAVARLALKSGYYNACLQNIQQAVEKFLPQFRCRRVCRATMWK